MEQGRLHPKEPVGAKARESSFPEGKANGQGCLEHRVENQVSRKGILEPGQEWH